MSDWGCQAWSLLKALEGKGANNCWGRRSYHTSSFFPFVVFFSSMPGAFWTFFFPRFWLSKLFKREQSLGLLGARVEMVPWLTHLTPYEHPRQALIVFLLLHLNSVAGSFAWLVWTRGGPGCAHLCSLMTPGAPWGLLVITYGNVLLPTSEPSFLCFSYFSGLYHLKSIEPVSFFFF